MPYVISPDEAKTKLSRAVRKLDWLGVWHNFTRASSVSSSASAAARKRASKATCQISGEAQPACLKVSYGSWWSVNLLH